MDEVREPVKNIRRLHVAALSVLACFFAIGCSKDPANDATIKYYLERAATAVKENALIMESKGAYTPKFAISGTGFSAEINLNQVMPLRERTLLTTDEFGSFNVGISIFQENDLPFLSDSLSWRSSDEVPPFPIVSFTEEATNDDQVSLVVSLIDAKDIADIWVEGDLAAEDASGKFLDR